MKGILDFSKKKGENLVVDKFILNNELLAQQTVGSNQRFLSLFFFSSKMIIYFKFFSSAN